MLRKYIHRSSVICFLTYLILMWTNGALAATYYVSTNGSDNNSGTSTLPWATFSKAISVLKPGDTLLVKDGTYYQALVINVSGSANSYITIKAQNDGQVTIDGQNAVIPCRISKADYINVEGVVCKNSSDEVFKIYGNRINVRRVSAYNANPDLNRHIFLCQLFNTCTSRRYSCFWYWKEMRTIFMNLKMLQYAAVGVDLSLIQHRRTSKSTCIYGSDDTIVENCIMTHGPQLFR
jgi:hypothetical protein